MDVAHYLRSQSAPQYDAYDASESSSDDDDDDVVLSHHRRPPKLGATRKNKKAKSLDINRYFSFDLDEEEEASLNLTPINISNYFSDGGSATTQTGGTKNEMTFLPTVAEFTYSDENFISTEPSISSELTLSKDDDDDLTDGEDTDQEKELMRRKSRLEAELSAIGTGFTSNFSFYKVEDVMEEEEVKNKKEERTIGKLTLPRMFSVVEEAMNNKELVRKQDDNRRRIEQGIDQRFREEASMLGQYVLPCKEKPHNEVIVGEEIEKEANATHIEETNVTPIDEPRRVVGKLDISSLFVNGRGVNDSLDDSDVSGDDDVTAAQSTDEHFISVATMVGKFILPGPDEHELINFHKKKSST